MLEFDCAQMQSVVAVSVTYRGNISDGYSVPDGIPTMLAFSSVNWCKIDVFTSNIMVLHHKMSQTVKINVNRYTNTYLLMNLFKMNQFILIFSCISALLSDLKNQTIVSSCVTHILPSCGYFKGQEQICFNPTSWHLVT